jgi:hypothetical protein
MSVRCVSRRQRGPSGGVRTGYAAVSAAARILLARMNDPGGNDAVFDRGRTALVVQEAPDDGHPRLTQ